MTVASRALSRPPWGDEAAPSDLGSELVRDGPLVLALVVSAAVFYLAPWPPLYGLALLAALAITLLRLDRALILVPLFAPYFMAPKHIGSKEFAPSEIFLALDLAVALVYFAVPRWESRLAWDRLLRSPFLPPAALFLVAGALSTALAVDHHVALRAYREWILEPVAFGGLVLLLTKRQVDWWWLFSALVAAGACVGVIGLWQYATQQNLSLVPGTSFKRVEALYGSPDNLGLFYDRVVCVWFAVLVLGRLRGAARLVALALAPIFVITLFLTYSRGAWLAVACGCLFVLALAYRQGRWLALACVALALVAVAAKGPSLVNALRAGHQHSIQQRLDIWRSSLHMVRDHPIVGVGPDNFLHYYAPTRQQNRWQRVCTPGLGYIQPDAGAEPCLSHPHDEVLDFWLSTGVLGLAAFAWLQVVFWWAAAGSWAAEQSAGQRSLLAGAMAAMLAALIHGLVDNSYFVTDLAIIFWLLCAYASYRRRSPASAMGPG